VGECPFLNWKVGCSTHDHWVYCCKAPWVKSDQFNRPGKTQISGFGLLPIAMTKVKVNEGGIILVATGGLW